MDHNHADDLVEWCSSSTDEKVEPGDLLEQCWFFGNLLHRKPMMSRCFSDPCPSSSYNQEMIMARDSDSDAERSASSADKLLPPKGGDCAPNLVRTPPMPPCLARAMEEVLVFQDKEGKSTPQPSRLTLHSTQCLPPDIGREEEEFQDIESEFSMGRLIRQASLTSSDALPPRYTASGAVAVGGNLRRHRPPRKLESISLEGCKEMRNRCQKNQRKMKKCLSNLESDEMKGYMDKGLTFDKEDLNPSLVNTLPGFGKKKGKSRRHHSEPWLAQNSALLIPNWVDKTLAKDMKAQIKHWARAVASNVRQEC